MVPNGWEIVPAEELCKSISVGIVIKPSQYYVDAENGVKAFRSANVREGKINDSNWVYLSHKGDSLNKKSKLMTGDVLIVRTGYPGTACVVTEEFEGSNAIDIVIARPNRERISPEYLCAFTNSEIGRAQVLNLQGGMAQQHLNVGAYQRLMVRLPPVPEQTRIANILSTWDKAITTAESLLINSQRQKKALMQQLLTGRKRFHRFSRDWKEHRLSEITTVLVSPVDKKSAEGEIPVLLCNYTDVYYNSKIVAGMPFMRATASTREVERFSLKKGDVIITKDSETPGDIAIPAYVSEDLDGVVCAYHLAIIRPKKEKVDGEFLSYLFSLQSTRYYFFTRASGATRFGLPVGGIEGAIFSIPELEEQREIAAVLSSADAKIEALKVQLAKFQQEKKSLMQQLLTGKVRVILK